MMKMIFCSQVPNDVLSVKIFFVCSQRVQYDDDKTPAKARKFSMSRRDHGFAVVMFSRANSSVELGSGSTSVIT